MGLFPLSIGRGPLANKDIAEGRFKSLEPSLMQDISLFSDRERCSTKVETQGQVQVT